MTIQIFENKTFTIFKLVAFPLVILLFSLTMLRNILERETAHDKLLLMCIGVLILLGIYAYIRRIKVLIKKIGKFTFYEDRFTQNYPNTNLDVKYDIITQIIYNKRTQYIKFKIDKFKKRGNFKFWYLMGDTLQFSLNDASTEQIDGILNNFKLLNKEIIIIDKYVF